MDGPWNEDAGPTNEDCSWNDRRGSATHPHLLRPVARAADKRDAHVGRRERAVRALAAAAEAVLLLGCARERNDHIVAQPRAHRRQRRLGAEEARRHGIVDAEQQEVRPQRAVRRPRRLELLVLRAAAAHVQEGVPPPLPCTP
eukprot:3813104-Prymnesium_polylepis.1